MLTDQQKQKESDTGKKTENNTGTSQDRVDPAHFPFHHPVGPTLYVLDVCTGF